MEALEFTPERGIRSCKNYIRRPVRLDKQREIGGLNFIYNIIGRVMGDLCHILSDAV